MLEKIHFKLTFNDKTHRFASALRGDELFYVVRSHVAKIVSEDDFKLCWSDDDSNVLLEGPSDLLAAMEYAVFARQNSNTPPCVHLTVTPSSAVEWLTAMTTELQLQKSRSNSGATTPASPLSAGSDSPTTWSPVVGRFSEQRTLLDSPDHLMHDDLSQLMYGDNVHMDRDAHFDVDFFSIKDINLSDGPGTELLFSCSSQRVFAAWHARVLGALEIPHESLSDSNQLSFTITLKSADLGRLLEQLTPLSSTTHFEVVHCMSEDKRTIEDIAHFLEKGSVHTIMFTQQRTSDFAPWLNMIRRCTPAKVDFTRLSLTSEVNNFLLEVADVVHAISLNEATSSSITQAVPLAIVHAVLSRKCSHLEIDDSSTVISLVQAGVFVKFFEKKGMRVSLTIPTTCNPIDAQVESYRVRTRDSNERRLISIEPFEVNAEEFH